LNFFIETNVHEKRGISKRAKIKNQAHKTLTAYRMVLEAQMLPL
jgi:hypothetical protein